MPANSRAAPDTPIAEFEDYLTIRTMNCLQNDSIRTIADLAGRTDQELLRIPNFGLKSLNEVKALLSSTGHRRGKQD